MKVFLARLAASIPRPLRLALRRSRLVLWVQRWFTRRVLGETAFTAKLSDGPAAGLSYPVELPLDRQFWLGIYELDFCEAIAAKVRPGSVCYDIGGYRAYVSGIMAARGAGEVHIFEPMPENIAKIESVLQLNPGFPMRLHRLALSNTVGEIGFRQLADRSMGKLETSIFESETQPETLVHVSTDRLDNLLAKGGVRPADLMKIDVEGAEFLVLSGARDLIATHHPEIFIEIHSHELGRQVSDFLCDLGYAVTVLETGSAPDFSKEDPVCHYFATTKA